MDSTAAPAMSRRLLAISCYMPPLLAPRAIQVPRSLAALEKLGWEITVITADAVTMDPHSHSDESLERASGGRYRSVVAKPPWPMHSKAAYRFLHRFRWSEPLWQRYATAAARRVLSTQPFQALLTFAQPWVDHVIGLDLRRIAGIPWVAHFSDPWADGPFAQGDRRLPEWRRQEEAVIRQADAIIFTNEYTLDLTMRKYPEPLRAKASVIPHGFDPQLLRFLAPSPSHPRLRMVFTGGFNKVRSPAPLLEALAEVNRTINLREHLEVWFVGANTRQYVDLPAAKGLSEVVSFLPQAPYLESAQIARDADVLLMIETPGEVSIFLPSKMIDYLAFGKPILGITPLQGASADLLRRLECPVVAPDDLPGIARAVASLHAAWREGSLGVSPAFQRVAREFEISQTTRALDAILRRVSGQC